MKSILAIALLASFVLLALPSASATPPQPICYDQYSKTTVGPVTIIRRNSCDGAHVLVCNKDVLDFLANGGTPPCT